jgi:Putative auto-transporter adhesin, head GIN domain
VATRGWIIGVTGVVLALSVACSAGDSGAGGGRRVTGSGSVVTETRDVENYEKVIFAGEGRVLHGAVSDGTIEIETDDNLVEVIETSVSGGTLTIGTRSGIDIEPSTEAIFRLGCPQLSGASLSGAGSIDLAGCTANGSVHLDMSGTGQILVKQLDSDDVRVSVSGTGNIEAGGRTEHLGVDLSGLGNFQGDELESPHVDVTLSGVGMATVWATDTLDVDISGDGTVRYLGSPQVSQTITGVGSVESLDSP